MTGLWCGFILLVLFLLWFDLGVLNRRAHVIRTREALRWTVLWVGLSLSFSVFVWFLYDRQLFGLVSTLAGREAVDQYLTGYIVELSLSMDNVFVIALIFQYFGVPRENQHRTLFWGIVGAMVFRGLMIGLGATLIHHFEWTLKVFGAILLATALRMLFSSDESVHPDDNPLVKLARRIYPVTSEYDGQKFLTRLPDGRRALTPLFLVLLVIESTDVLFAVDSIPAIFGITRDPFIVFTSNVFAILGLRSLYFVLAGMMARFHYLKPSLVVVLLFIATKMLLPHHLEVLISARTALLVVLGILGVGVVLSLLHERRHGRPSETPSH